MSSPSVAGRMRGTCRRYSVAKARCDEARPACSGGLLNFRKPDERNGMAKEELLEFEGTVVDVLPEARFRVLLDNQHEVLAYSAGRMQRNRIKTLRGDRVTVEMSPYDLTKGRIIYRHKSGNPAKTEVRRPNFRRSH